MASPEALAAPLLFRHGKKRKAYRHRAEDNEPVIAGGSPGAVVAPQATTTIAPDDDSEERSVAEALRLRNARKHRNGGVAFRAGPSSNGEGGGMTEENPEMSIVLHDSAEGDSALLGGITQRFAPQTGLVGELVNKHMEEYVESELARRKRHAAEALQKEDEDAAAKTEISQLAMATPVLGKQAESQRVLHGKLLEIDLGDEARARNIEMTERARRRLEGLGADEDDDSASGRHKRPRLGPDGKPWRSRNRRGSEDIKRDRLVEEFLSENSLGVYDVQPEQPVTMAGLEDDETAADDRIAEEFRREFMDAMSQRRRRKVAQPAKPGTKKDEEVLKGPKLGGSRNARAAMRDILLKEQEKKKRW
ncbi:hepatocellular carcinoma-associated antigen 59-domain-containing protein [Immersiella caudata]|uniref:Hepatocellular carcinoma-associated antigen 59-domain-containing protein n=1 Tax=Immersiella caudata TaxID=314043 RepID=A0AA39XG58_9PEZI|nr:hepatocellular carcinoma-associated antigen 59-domain-containing protein [Immersiella caudata]